MIPTVLFYSPMKRPDDQVASGVSRAGALFVRAIEQCGFAVESPDLPSTYDASGTAARQNALCGSARSAASRLVDDLRRRGLTPFAWFTYHCYYKSPDVVGPIVASAFNCSYAIAEGSYARKRIGGPWASHHDEAANALARADILLSATDRDCGGLEIVPNRRGTVVTFPPFVDCDRFAPVVRGPQSGRVRILSAGSMRDRRKLRSHHFLFESIEALDPRAVSLRIAGDGPGREDLETHAAALREKGFEIDLLGQLPPSQMPGFFAQGDLFAWPGIEEAYGLTYLEAQAAGLPVVALDSGGVSACVKNAVSGALVSVDEPDAYAKALRDLCSDEHMRRALGDTARSWVTAERSLNSASDRLRGLLRGGVQ